MGWKINFETRFLYWLLFKSIVHIKVHSNIIIRDVIRESSIFKIKLLRIDVLKKQVAKLIPTDRRMK